jgi:hypothetical protein
VKVSLGLLASSVLAALVSLSCGYTLVGEGSFLPPNIKTISFPTFKNATNRVGLEQRLSAAVVQELIARGRFKVSAKEGEGDAQLEGTITGFLFIPLSTNTQSRAVEYQIQVTVKVSLTTIPEGKVLWKNDNYVFRENYDVTGRGIYTTNYLELENVAIDAEAERFAQSLVTSLLEGF